MLSVAEAQVIVLEHARPLPPRRIGLSAGLLGSVLAEDVCSDLDLPPFDKSLMDGYALRAQDCGAGGGVFTVIEEVTAGQMPRLQVGAGQATRIMTGAPMPAGADAVVMVERTRTLEDGRIRIDDQPPKPGQNILGRAREMKQGEIVLKAGAVLRPQELGILGSVGRAQVLVHPAPRVAVVPTGDEVVEVSEKPQAGQIRNGNGPMLLGQVSRAGGVPRFVGIARDNVESLKRLIADGLQDDVLVLSGGVSAGKLDLVPSVLEDLGVGAHFHKVAMKPGKPVLFGTRGATLIFGLPGNPVSSLVCFELFVRPGLRKLAGHAAAGSSMVRALLSVDYAYRSDRPTYHPAILEMSDTGWQVRPVPWFGSPDLRGLSASNAFVLFPAGDHQHRAGDLLPVLRVESAM